MSSSIYDWFVWFIGEILIPFISWVITPEGTYFTVLGSGLIILGISLVILNDCYQHTEGKSQGVLCNISTEIVRLLKEKIWDPLFGRRY